MVRFSLYLDKKWECPYDYVELPLHSVHCTFICISVQQAQVSVKEVLLQAWKEMRVWSLIAQMLEKQTVSHLIS